MHYVQKLIKRNDFLEFLTNKFSAWLANRWCDKDENRDDFELYEFYLKGMCYFTLYAVISLILGYFFEYILYVPLTIFTFLYLRGQCGGYHHTEKEYCLINTCGFYAFVGIMSIHCYEGFLMFFLFSLCAFTNLQEVPKFCEHEPNFPVSKRNLFRQMYLTRIQLLFTLNVFFMMLYFLGKDLVILGLFRFNCASISTVISLIMIINRYCLTDFAFNVVKKLPKLSKDKSVEDAESIEQDNDKKLEGESPHDEKDVN